MYNVFDAHVCLNLLLYLHMNTNEIDIVESVRFCYKGSALLRRIDVFREASDEGKMENK